MSSLILNIVVILVALLVLFSVWIGVHLLARKRMGDRKLGCRGPATDAEGNSICCQTGEACELAPNSRTRMRLEQGEK